MLSVLLFVAQAYVSPDWSMYRVGARDCKMRRVDPVSAMVMFGGSDCVPKSKSRRMIAAPLTSDLAMSGGRRVSARVVSEAPMPTSAPQAKLLGLVPGPSRLQIVLSENGEERVVAETMGSAREIVGLASDGSRVVVVYRYEKPDEHVLALDVLGVNLF